MKKSLLSLLLILFITGCGKEDNIAPIDYSINKNYYDVYKDYKLSADNNYIVSNITSKYDLEEVELGLMRISTEYFSTDKYYYQSGQYLNKKTQQELLKILNQQENETINGISLLPKYISYIYEQNYVNSVGKTIGISLGIILNPYQIYTNENGVVKYIEKDQNDVLNYGKEKANMLLKELKKINDFKDKKILLALYLQNSPNSLVPGNYYYEKDANNFNINDFNKLDEKYYLLPSEEFSNVDTKLSESYTNFENDVTGLLSDYTSVVGKALYSNNKCLEINLNVNIAYPHKGDVLAVSQKIVESIVNNFDFNIYMQVNVKSNNELEAIVLRKNNSFEPKIYILD